MVENQAIELPNKTCDGCLFSIKLEREALELACQDLLDIDASIFIGQVKHLEFDLIRNQSH